MDINIPGSTRVEILVPPEAISLDHRPMLRERICKVGNICIRCASIVAFSLASVMAIQSSTHLLIDNIAPTPLGGALIGIYSVAVGAILVTTATLCATYIDMKLDPAMSRPASFSSLISSPLTKVTFVAGAGYGAIEGMLAANSKFG